LLSHQVGRSAALDLEHKVSRKNLFVGTATVMAMALTAVATIAVPAIAQPLGQEVERQAGR
jgi:hypothetical protein